MFPRPLPRVLGPFLPLPLPRPPVSGSNRTGVGEGVSQRDLVFALRIRSLKRETTHSAVWVDGHSQNFEKKKAFIKATPFKWHRKIGGKCFSQI